MSWLPDFHRTGGPPTRSTWLAEAAPPVLGGIAEAAWIGVFAAAVLPATGGPGAVDNQVALAVAALFGVAAGRFLPFARWRPAAIFAIAVLAAGAALILTDQSGAQASSQLQRAIFAVLVGLAALRGVVHGDPAAGDQAIAGLVRWGAILLAVGWLFGLTISGASRPRFIAGAFEASLLFVVAGALGLGSARLTGSALETRGVPRTDRAWLVLLLVVGGAALIGLPVAALVGVPLASGITSAVIGAVLAFFGLILGLVGIVAAPIGALLATLIESVAAQPTPQPSPSPVLGEPPPAPPPLPGGNADSVVSDPIASVILVIALVVLIVVAWYLSRRWQGALAETRVRPERSERRSFRVDLGDAIPSLHLAARLRKRRPPHGAIDAYPRLVEDWSISDERKRRPAETPAIHARRLRGEGRGDLGFDLLVADFELASFAETAVTGREDARAVSRWRRLRRPRPPLPDGTLSARGVDWPPSPK
jgi:hypothetical protein